MSFFDPYENNVDKFQLLGNAQNDVYSNPNGSVNPLDNINKKLIGNYGTNLSNNVGGLVKNIASGNIIGTIKSVKGLKSDPFSNGQQQDLTQGLQFGPPNENGLRKILINQPQDY